MSVAAMKINHAPTLAGLLHGIADAPAIAVAGIATDSRQVREGFLFLACEGRVVAIVDSHQADQVLEKWQALPDGKDAAIIGNMDAKLSQVILETDLGGERILEELEDDPLPRIC